MLVDEFLRCSAERFSGKTALVSEGCRLSYSEFDDRASRIAHALVDRGIEPGDRVALLLENGIEAALSIFGVLKAGAVFVFLGQTLKPGKLNYVLNDCAASALISQQMPFDVISAVKDGVPSLKAIFVFGDYPLSSASDDIVRFNSDLDGHRPFTSPSPAIDLDVAALIYTSGTTGYPKGVAVSHHNVVSAATSITQYLENVPGDVILNFLPFSFDYGLYQLIMSVKMGATLVLEKSFAYPYRIVERVHEEGVTGFPGIPTVFAILLQMDSIDPSMFDSVRYVSNTAAALPLNHINGIRRLFRNARVFSMYGLTECKRVSYLPPEELDRRPMSVGRGMPNERVYVVDESGDPVPPGTVGELVVSGSNVMLGYWNDIEATERVIRPGRYPWERLLYTGDLFRMDDEGFLFFVSRKDDIIKSRGEKVSPIEVERVIHELHQVKDVAVVGIPDPILGQALKAFVVPAEEAALTEREIISHCSRMLESFMVPKHVEFRKSLPLTGSGKVARKELAEEC